MTTHLHLQVITITPVLFYFCRLFTGNWNYLISNHDIVELLHGAVNRRWQIRVQETFKVFNTFLILFYCRAVTKSSPFCICEQFRKAVQPQFMNRISVTIQMRIIHSKYWALNYGRCYSNATANDLRAGSIAIRCVVILRNCVEFLFMFIKL